ncbi:MAG: aminotransferase class I/II-fold pyridoxal phosphate-dependent enzyme [Kofleriaceae bacterium]
MHSSFIDPLLAAASPPKKRDYRGLLNLSSNEASHPLVRALSHRWAGRWRPSLHDYIYPPRELPRIASRLGVSVESLYLTAGADHAIQVVCASLGRSCGRLIVRWPNYPNYVRYAEVQGMSVERWWPRAGDDLAVLDCAPALVVVTSPDAFTGEQLADEELDRLATSSAANGHLLVLDETYGAFAPTCHLDWASRRDNIVIIRSFSKSLGAAGLRLAAIAAAPTLIQYLARSNAINAVSVAAIDYAVFAFDETNELRQAHRAIADVRDRLIERILAVEPLWRSSRSRANFAWFEAEDVAAAEAAYDCALASKIAIRWCHDLAGAERWVRITAADDDATNRVVAALSEREPRWRDS